MYCVFLHRQGSPSRWIQSLNAQHNRLNMSIAMHSACSKHQGCILAGISFLSISSLILPTRKSGIRRDKYLSAAIFKEAVHSDDS